MPRFRHRHTTTDLEGKFTVNLQSNIGGGVYGTVYTCKNQTEETFAVKKFFHRLPNKENCSEEEKVNVERFVAELSTLKGLEHPNIAKLIDVFEGIQQEDWLVTEYCENGDLNKYLAKETPDKSHKLNIMLQCSRGVEYLHGLNPPLVHRDIKPGNVLLKSVNREMLVKLADLGLAKIYENHPDPKIKDDISEKCMVGSCYFMAPEIFEENDALMYKEPVDVFALGLLFLVLHRYDAQRLDANRQILPVSVEHLNKDLTAANILFYGEELINYVQEKIERPQLFTDDDTGPLQKLIVRMTDYYPERRPKVTEIVQELQNIFGQSEPIPVPESGFHPGGARPRTHPEGRRAASSGTILQEESYAVTAKVFNNTKLKKKEEAMDSLTEACDEVNNIRMVTPRNTRGRYDRRQKCKNILLIGETGSGKTSLVNGIYNYIRQVKWDEPNRYCITEFDKNVEVERDQSQSQTDWITVYSLPTDQSFIINIVDTPGLADTRKVEEDVTFKRRLQEFFQNSKGHGILTIDAVCCVWSASERRLTAARSKIIESVKSLFARDILDNMVCLACFADEFEPEVYNLMPIPQKNKFKFNNGILFKGRGLRNTWDSTMESYQQFFNFLINIEPVSTTLTVELLQQTTVLEQEISLMKQDVQNYFELVQEHQSIVQQLKQKTGEDNTVPNIKAIYRYQEAVVNDGKKESLQCEKCKKTTCHYPCKEWDVNIFKYLFCERFGWWGTCRLCGHNVSDHFKDPTKHYEERKVNVDQSVAELIEQYMKDENKEKNKEDNGQNNKKTKKTVNDLIQTLEALQETNMTKLTHAMHKIHQLNKELHRIALYMPTKETIGELIDDFIEEEEREKKEGYKERVKIYEECKQNIAANQPGGDDDFGDVDVHDKPLVS